MNRIILIILAFTLGCLAPRFPLAKADDDGPKTRVVDCVAGDTVGKALAKSKRGDTVLVQGTCNENILLTAPEGNGVTLDGTGGGTINGPDATLNVLELDGVSALLIKNLAVSGGNDGISINGGSRIAIDGVTVNKAGRHGIHFQRASTGFVVNAVVTNNPGNGVVVNENSYVRVGFTDGVGASEGATGPCVVSSNGGHGIRVQRNSAARIYVTTIDGNTNDGVHVESDSYAEVASDEIGANGKNGVFASENSVVHLGNPTGTKTEDTPNTSTAANGAFGIAASWGAYAQGRIGSLIGASGAESFTHGANNNLM
jgi:hypothetical protein